MTSSSAGVLWIRTPRRSTQSLPYSWANGHHLIITASIVTAVVVLAVGCSVLVSTYVGDGADDLSFEPEFGDSTSQRTESD
jgi:hypothetical protein